MVQNVANWWDSASNRAANTPKLTLPEEQESRFKLDSTYLKQPTKPFDFMAPPFEPIQFAKDLIKFMYQKNGIGLAANQIGYDYSVFAMRGEPENFVLYNPKIVWYSDMEVVLDEGCLSYPGLFVKIKRPQHIRMRANTPNGDMITRKFTGMTARIIQHEFDHLQGICYYSRVSKLKLEMAIKKGKKAGFIYQLKDLV